MSNADPLLKASEVRRRLDVSDAWLHRAYHNPSLGFPEPTYMNYRRYWRESEIEEFIARIRQDGSQKPKRKPPQRPKIQVVATPEKPKAEPRQESPLVRRTVTLREDQARALEELVLRYKYDSGRWTTLSDALREIVDAYLVAVDEGCAT